MVSKAQELERQGIGRRSEDHKEPRDADARPWTPSSDSRSAPNGEHVRRSSKRAKSMSQGSEVDVVYANILSLPSRLRSLSHKQSVANLRLARELSHKRSQSFPGASPQWTKPRAAVTRAALDKPLPPLPRTEDTTVLTEWAPAVTHHTIQRDVHHVHQEFVTNEFHQDEYVRRILPVDDHEILPARHFVQLDGGVLEEISEDMIPGELPLDLQQRISDAAATIFRAGARDSGVAFPSFDGSADQEWTSRRNSLLAEGHVRRDTTWTYPPNFLPTRFGPEQQHRLFVHLDGADGGVGSAHVRSFSDGPPPIPPRGVRNSDVVLGGSSS